MPKLAIIGIGNELCADDGLGIYALRSLAKEGLSKNIVVLDGGTDVAACLQTALSVEKLIIVDAIVRGDHPGTLHILALQEAWQKFQRITSIHEASLLNLLILYCKKPKEGYLIGMEPASLAFGIGLSPQVEAGMEKLLHQIKEKVSELSTDSPNVFAKTFQ